MRNDPTPIPVFEFLDKTHGQIASHLDELTPLVQQALSGSWDSAQCARVQTICRYFDTEARQHHMDEELHVLPALAASPDEKLRQVADQVAQDHGWLEGAWLELEPLLRASAEHQSWVDPDLLAQHFELLLNLYKEHMVLEESVAYPAARAVKGAWDAESIGREMARRRASAQR